VGGPVGEVLVNGRSWIRGLHLCDLLLGLGSHWARPCPRAVDVRGTSWIVRAELGQFRTGFSHSDFRGLGRLPLGSVLVCAA